MMRTFPATLVASALMLLASSVPMSHAAARVVRVQFPKGASSVTVTGELKGYSDIDYLVSAGAGQTMTATLKVSNRSAYFNVLPLGSKEVAMFAPQTGERFLRLLPADGDYTIRVYLIRAAARRNETSKFALTVSVTGKRLPPTSASKDAVLPGTPYHARTEIACVPAIEKYRGKKAQRCQTFVIRRGFDGTATALIPQEGSVPRRILFVKGKPVASDSPHPIVSSRKGDVTVVTFDQDERYEIPGVLLTGG
jgi:hypothetical protein